MSKLSVILLKILGSISSPSPLSLINGGAWIGGLNKFNKNIGIKPDKDNAEVVV